MMGEREAVVWCPRCRTEKFEVWRVRTENEDVFEHITQPLSIPPEARKRCECGTQLERKS